MTYKEISSGHVVDAVLCEHGGILMEIMALGEQARFEDGDFIVTYPENFEHVREKKIIKSDVFGKKFVPINVKQGVDWASMGWKV